MDLILGLPAHPLIVHVAVVILPLAAASLIAIVLIPAARQAFGWVVVVGLAIGAGGALLAKDSGEALAARVGWPGDHAVLGDRLPAVAFGLLAAGIAWFALMRRDSSRTSPADRRTSAVTRVVGTIACAMAAATIALTVVVGHSGAEAVWADRIDGERPLDPAATPTALTVAEVARHARVDDCWSVVEGQVYDLTAWIAEHPGGAGPIESMCGVDATEAFRAMHGSEPGPRRSLDGFSLGPLAVS